MYRIGLNLNDMDNNAFYCPASNVRLTRMNPVGVFKEITPSVLRGLKGGTLIDVDKKIDKKIYLSKSQLELEEINNATESVNQTTQNEQDVDKPKDKPKGKSKDKPKDKDKAEQDVDKPKDKDKAEEDLAE